MNIIPDIMNAIARRRIFDVILCLLKKSEMLKTADYGAIQAERFPFLQKERQVQGHYA